MLELNMLESIIFSRLKGQFSQKIKAKYPNLTFTTQEESKGTPKFPNVYVCLESGKESELTLERTYFEAGEFTFLISVKNNAGQTAVGDITNEIIRIMKKMSFTIVGTTVYKNDADIQWSATRFFQKISRNSVL